MKQEQSPWSLDSDSQSCRLRIRDRFTEVHRGVMSGQDLGSETGTWQVGKARSVGRCEEGKSFYLDEKAWARPQRHKDDGNSQRQHGKTDAAHAGFSGSPWVLVKTQIAPPPGSGVPASVGVWYHPRICISLSHQMVWCCWSRGCTLTEHRILTTRPPGSIGATLWELPHWRWWRTWQWVRQSVGFPL